MKYLTLRELSQKIGGRSHSSIYRDLAAGRLPKPIKLGVRIYWNEDQVDRHLREMACEDGGRHET